MNWIVIAIGTALVLVLTAASVGPYFVDWTAYRDTIEANASRLIGVGVTIDGDAEVRILPSPRIVVHNVGLGVGDAPLVTARTVDLDVALMPLLSGELRVKQLRLDAPHVDVSISPAGTIDFPPLQVDDGIQSLFTAEDVTVESITVEDGQIELRDSRTGRTHTVEGLALNGNARSLTGPFTAEGRAEIGGAPATVRVAGGQLEAGTMPLSVRVTPQDANAEMSFEGAIVPRAEAPSVRGELTVSAMAGTVPFSLSGGIAADLSEIVFTRGTLSYGAPANAIELTAAASLSLIDNTPAVLALSARQLDLDRLDRALFGSDTPTLRPPAETVEGIMEHLGPLYSLLMGQGGSAREVSVGLDLGAVVVGGALVEEVSLAARSNGTTFTIERAEAVFPGDSTAEFSGTLTGGVRGSLRLSAAQPSVLARWWSGAAAPNPLGGTIDPILLETDLS
ncbi:MAG: AsmA family protein, partial [Pseudomonadota bacterium]